MIFGAAVAGLGWLLEFVLGPALSGSLTDRLKRRPSSERAKDRAYRLYEALGRLRATSAAFVAALRLASDPAAARADAGAALQDALRDISEALAELAAALEAVDPQLEVHVPPIAEEVNRARGSRALNVSHAEESLMKLARGEEDASLGAVLADAERSHAQIEQATEGVRAFIASEFSFKDSF